MEPHGAADVDDVAADEYMLFSKNKKSMSVGRYLTKIKSVGQYHFLLLYEFMKETCIL